MFSSSMDVFWEIFPGRLEDLTENSAHLQGQTSQKFKKHQMLMKNEGGSCFWCTSYIIMCQWNWKFPEHHINDHRS